MRAHTHIITHAIYIQACTTHTLHTLNKAISNVDKTITDYTDVKEKSFLEIPVRLSLTMKSLSACHPADTRHPDRLPGSRLCSGAGGVESVTIYCLCSRMIPSCSTLKPHQLCRLTKGLCRDLILFLGGGGEALSMLTCTFYLLTLDQICCVIVVGSVLKNR